MISAVLHSITIIADILYNLTSWKFNIYNYIICVIWMLKLCVLRLLKEISNWCEPGGGSSTSKRKHFFKCSLRKLVQHVIVLKKNDAYMHVPDYTTKPRANLMVFKFTWAGTGLENIHYFHKGWLHLARGFRPFFVASVAFLS